MQLIEIGRLGKTFGVEGKIRCKINAGFLKDFLQVEALFVKINGHPVPYFVEAIQQEPELTVSIEDINDKESAQTITGKVLYLRKEDLSEGSTRVAETDLEELSIFVGFQLIDEEKGPVGEIMEFVEMPQQILAVVNYQEKELYIPFQQQLILNIKLDEQQVIMDLPEGILDL